MRKQIILTTAIVFVINYLVHAFIILDIDFRNWNQSLRAGYLFLSIFLTLGFSTMIYINKKYIEK